jgi:cytochrome P450
VFCNPAFSEENLRLVAESTVKLTNLLFGQWDEQIHTSSDGKCCGVSVTGPMRNLTMGVISQAGFGVDSQSIFERSNSKGEMTFHEALGIVGSSLISRLVIPRFVLKLPIPHLKRIDTAFRLFESQLKELIHNARSSTLNSEKRDILTQLAKAEQEESTAALTPLEVLSDAFIFLFAGHETTAK